MSVNLECNVVICNVPNNHKRFLAVKCVANDVWYYGSADSFVDALKLCRDDEDMFVTEVKS